MKIWELDLNKKLKYKDNNGNVWKSNSGELLHIDANSNLIYIESFYPSLASLFELTFEEVE